MWSKAARQAPSHMGLVIIKFHRNVLLMLRMAYHHSSMSCLPNVEEDLDGIQLETQEHGFPKRVLFNVLFPLSHVQDVCFGVE